VLREKKKTSFYLYDNEHEKPNTNEKNQLFDYYYYTVFISFEIKI